MQNVFFVLKKKISAKDKFKKTFRNSPSLHVLSKVLQLLSRQTMSQSFLAKIKATLTFLWIPFDSPSKSYPFHKGQLSLHGSQSHDFNCDIWWQIHLTTRYPPYNYIDIWLSLNNTTTHAFFPNISVSPITLFHQINKKTTSILLLWKRCNNSYCFIAEIRAKYNNILSRVKTWCIYLAKKHAILCILEHSTEILTLKRYLQTWYNITLGWLRK